MEVAVPSLGDPLLYDRNLGVLALHMDMVDSIPPSTVLQHTCKKRGPENHPTLEGERDVL